jgi:hypothetical protein
MEHQISYFDCHGNVLWWGRGAFSNAKQKHTRHVIEGYDQIQGSNPSPFAHFHFDDVARSIHE